jgi:hypothetical protein
MLCNSTKTASLYFMLMATLVLPLSLAGLPTLPVDHRLLY